MAMWRWKTRLLIFRFLGEALTSGDQDFFIKQLRLRRKNMGAGSGRPGPRTRFFDWAGSLFSIVQNTLCL